MEIPGCFGRVALFFLLLAIGCAALAAPGAARVAVEVPDVFVFKSTGMVPLPPMLELYGATLTTKGAAITVSRAGKSFSFTLDKPAAQANGTAVKLDLAPFKTGEVIFVPLRPLVAALGGTVKAEGNGLRVTIGAASYQLPVQKMTREDAEGTVAVLPNEYRDINAQLFVMNPDGTSLRRLTYTVMGNSLPTFTADGSKWVNIRNYVFFPFGNVYSRSFSNGQVTRLYTGDMEGMTRMCISAVPMPDGSAVLYSEIAQVGNDQELWIYSVPFKGGKAKKMFEGLFPEISPDGKTMAYCAPDEEKEKSLIALLNLATKEKILLGYGQYPSFSPDGNMLLFKRPFDEGKQTKGVFITCQLDAAAKHVLSPMPENPLKDEESASFSPDGQRIVFKRDGEGLFSMKPDRSDERQLTTNKHDATPVFSPDGTYIYFTRDGKVCRMKADGSDITPQTKEINAHELRFSPDGTLLFLTCQPQALFG